jgi:hypothetical protein
MEDNRFAFLFQGEMNPIRPRDRPTSQSDSVISESSNGTSKGATSDFESSVRIASEEFTSPTSPSRRSRRTPLTIAKEPGQEGCSIENCPCAKFKHNPANLEQCHTRRCKHPKSAHVIKVAEKKVEEDDRENEDYYEFDIQSKQQALQSQSKSKRKLLDLAAGIIDKDGKEEVPFEKDWIDKMFEEKVSCWWL